MFLDGQQKSSILHQVQRQLVGAYGQAEDRGANPLTIEKQFGFAGRVESKEQIGFLGRIEPAGTSQEPCCSRMIPGECLAKRCTVLSFSSSIAIV
jgi:hypothetical protein